MRPEKNFEDFIRMAFKHGLGKEIGRRGDPASLANTDSFSENNICSVKVALGYSMEIYLDELINSKEITEQEIQRLEDFVCKVINAKNLNEIHNIKINFEKRVLKKYYSLNNGMRKLK